jgi:hypothetical protein
MDDFDDFYSSKDEIFWSGRAISIQPQIRLMQSFDEWTHSYLGYNLTDEGQLGEASFLLTIHSHKGIFQWLFFSIAR